MNFEIIKSIVLVLCILYVAIDVLFLKIPVYKKYKAFKPSSSNTEINAVDVELVKEVYKTEGHIFLVERLAKDNDAPTLVLDVSKQKINAFFVELDCSNKVKLLSAFMPYYYDQHTYDGFLKTLCKHFYNSDMESMLSLISWPFLISLENTAANKFKGNLV